MAPVIVPSWRVPVEITRGGGVGALFEHGWHDSVCARCVCYPSLDGLAFFALGYPRGRHERGHRQVEIIPLPGHLPTAFTVMVTPFIQH